MVTVSVIKLNVKWHLPPSWVLWEMNFDGKI